MAEEWVVHPNAGLQDIKNAKDLKPEIVGPTLQRYATNKLALEAARSNRNPLHKHLEWNDAVCGEKHRLGQIASLRSCIRLYDIEEDDAPKRAFISLSDENDAHHARYYSRQEVIDSVEIQRQVLRKWINLLCRFKEDLREMRDLCEGAREFGERLESRLTELNDRAA